MDCSEFKMNHPASPEKIILSGCLIFNHKKELLLLFRKDHQWYETPGGKVKPQDCKNSHKILLSDLANTAQRELKEELGEKFQFQKLTYFGKVAFTLPDGRKFLAHKFSTKILSGKPQINEPETFSKLDHLSIDQLEQYPLSPDLKLLLRKIKTQ